MASSGVVKAIILVGGPSKGTRFRPLSLDVAKPLFPVAGHPLIYHHLEACTQLPNLKEVLLMGFYDFQDKQWQQFLDDCRSKLGLSIKCLKEDSRLGTAGGLKKFKKEILEGNPEHILLMHCDIFCEFPVKELMAFHVAEKRTLSMLGKKVPKDEAQKYGCVALDPSTNEMLHYAEKPETFISDIINAGIYIFAPGLFDVIDKVAATHHHEAEEAADFLRLEQDVLMKICGEKHVYVFVTGEFWFQLKSAGMVIPLASRALAHLKKTHPEKLAKSGDGKKAPLIVGDVLIDPTAQVDPTAKIGPNVSIGAKAKIGPGVRISNSIVLDNAEVKGRTCIIYSIVGWNCTVGQWCRIEGVPNFSADSEDALKYGVSILGSGVVVGSESIVRASIALPHKELSGSYHSMILL